jgi:hypothetical protein
MRVLRILFLVLAFTVGLPVGGLLFYWSMEFKAVAQRTKETPDRVPAAQLADKGVPDNLYVDVTDFTFGTPVVETSKQGWAYVWLPVEPATESEKEPPYTIFLRVNVQDQVALDRFVKRGRCGALIATGLPKSSKWRIGCGAALQKAYPEQDWSKAMLLAEPRLKLFDYPVELSDPRLHDPEYESAAVWGGGALVLFGLASLYFLMKGKKQPGGAAVPALEAETLRAQLQTERPESVHRARLSGVAQRAVGYLVLVGVLVLGLLAATGSALLAQNRGQSHAAVILVFVAVVALLPVRAAFRAFLRMFRFPTDIAVCPGGVRWRQGSRQRAILWSEVAEVRRDIKVIQRFQGTGIVGAMRALNNPAPPLIKDTVRIELETGEAYVLGPDMVTSYPQLAETAPRLWKEDGLRSEAAPTTAAWLQALRK